jgi:uncharacterized protein involved in response to NO
VADAVADVHPDVGLCGFDAMNGGIATDGGVLRRQVMKEFCGPANQAGLQQVLLFWKAGFVQALGVALLLEGLSVGLQALGQAGLGLAPLHALTVGYLGCTLVAMATRVASGHSGRPLAVDGPAWAFYLLLQATAVLRLAAVWDGRLLLLAALGWAVVAAAWALRYGRWLGQPRADGRPG